jgi:1-phosphatidylinositol phosphodiesterase
MKFITKNRLVILLIFSILALEIATRSHKRTNKNQSKNFSKLSRKRGREISNVFSDELFSKETTDTYNYFDAKNWMSLIKDDTYISQLSIPGTHDTCANQVENNSWFVSDGTLLAQFNTVKDQLENGIRYLDIRGSPDGKIYHNSYWVKTTFVDVLNTIKTFLSVNTKEVVIMRLKNESGNTSNDNDGFKKWFTSVLATYKDLFCLETIVPTLGKCRGKIWLLVNFGLYYDSFRWDSPDLILQDNFSLKVGWYGISDKKKDIQKFVDTYKSESSRDVAKLYVNHSSASPLLSTGTIKDVARETNQQILVNTSGFLGIAVFDFPSRNVLKFVIAHNADVLAKATAARRRMKRKLR